MSGAEPGTPETAERLTPEARAFLAASDLARIVDLAPAHLYAKDLEGVYIYASFRPPLAGDGDLVGRTDFDYHDREQAEALRANDREVIAAGRAKLFQESGRNGSRFLSAKSPLRDGDGRTIGTIGRSIELDTAAAPEGAAEEPTARR